MKHPYFDIYVSYYYKKFKPELTFEHLKKFGNRALYDLVNSLDEVPMTIARYFTMCDIDTFAYVSEETYNAMKKARLYKLKTLVVLDAEGIFYRGKRNKLSDKDLLDLAEDVPEFKNKYLLKEYLSNPVSDIEILRVMLRKTNFAIPKAWLEVYDS